MASSYTPLLGFVLPVTGELAGTWGTVWNNEGTSLLDSSIAGTTTLSTDADVTLTTTTGAANQARQAILLCSGARTALRTITAPAQSKIYVVINSTTGGFGVVIRGVGPTTGVTVANGKTAVVVWNGSDFVEVAPAAATTATNLAGGLAGSLPYQTAAGTTTMLAIGTANYVLTSTGTAPTWTINTGTGSVVRATSPTIATPTVTTSATVPLLIGGTGTTSTLALRSTSGVGAAGADIIFQTGNNGATEAMRILNSGNVGIGIASPGARLDVTSTAAFTARFSGPANSYVDVTDGTGTFRAQLLSNTPFLTSIGAYGLIFGTNNTERMRIDSSGNVGIGTTSPQAKLHVAGSGAQARFEVTTAADARHEYYRNSVREAYLSWDANILSLAATQASGVMTFATGGTTERMRIDSSGRLLVAATTASGSQMDIVDATGQNNRALTISRSATDAAAKSSAISNRHWLNAEEPVILVGAGIDDNTNNFVRMGGGFSNLNSATILQFYTASNNATLIGTERMRIDASGNVGIGTIAPVNKLQVNGSFGRNAPVTKTGSFTLADTENWIICNGTGTITVTLPAASSWTGREVMIKTIAAFTVVSVASDVVPLAGGAAGTAILAATAGKFATLVSDGTNWIIMQAN